jgi:hypothetical protein
MMPKGMAPITSGRVSRAPLKNSVHFDFKSMSDMPFTCHYIQENHSDALSEFTPAETNASANDLYQRWCLINIPTNTYRKKFAVIRLAALDDLID